MQPRLLLLALAALLTCLWSCASGSRASSSPATLAMRDGVVPSSDGVPIHYRAGGRGEIALVFVHGWLGDASVWEPMLTRFAPRYRVVALDLAGHGESGGGRTQWTVDRFADDVAAVVRDLDLDRAVLVGHSMSGPITVKASRVLGPRVVALVPVDTMLNVEWDLPPEAWEVFFGGLRADFPSGVEYFFRGVLTSPSSPKEVIDRIVAGAKTADPSIAVPMLERGREYDLRSDLEALTIPLCAVNSDLNPTMLEINRKYAPRFDVVLLHGLGHWPHLEDPHAFGEALEQALGKLGVAR